jgi:hypothetical protein
MELWNESRQLIRKSTVIAYFAGSNKSGWGAPLMETRSGPCCRVAWSAQGWAERELGACPSAQGLEEDRAVGVTGMDYHVMEAEYVSGFVVKLRFRDETVGEIDLEAALTGPMFEPLRNLEIFRQFRVDPGFHTLVWPNVADLAPEFLRQCVSVTTSR